MKTIQWSCIWSWLNARPMLTSTDPAYNQHRVYAGYLWLPIQMVTERIYSQPVLQMCTNILFSTMNCFKPVIWTTEMQMSTTILLITFHVLNPGLFAVITSAASDITTNCWKFTLYCQTDHPCILNIAGNIITLKFQHIHVLKLEHSSHGDSTQQELGQPSIHENNQVRQESAARI